MDNFKNKTIIGVLTTFLAASTYLHSDNAEARRFFIPKGGITDHTARVPGAVHRHHQRENMVESKPKEITAENCEELAPYACKALNEDQGKTLHSDSVTIAKPENDASHLTDEYIINNLKPIKDTNCFEYRGGAICGDFKDTQKQAKPIEKSQSTEQKIIDFTGNQCDTGFAIFNDKCPP